MKRLPWRRFSRAASLTVALAVYISLLIGAVCLARVLCGEPPESVLYWSVREDLVLCIIIALVLLLLYLPARLTYSALYCQDADRRHRIASLLGSAADAARQAAKSRRRARARRALKWSGTLFTVLLLMIYVASVWWSIVLWMNQRRCVVAVAGAVFYSRVDPPGSASPSARQPGLKWSIERLERSAIVWMPKYEEATFDASRPRRVHGSYEDLWIPLWIPLVLIAVASVLLWWLDRWRPLPGHCRKCGYDLTGNVSGRCPECGQTVAGGAT